MKKRIGIIGFGWIARDVHYPNYLTIADECEITAVCDINPTAIENAKNKTGLSEDRIFTDYKELIDSGLCDAVDICTPNYLHCEIAKYALNKGLGVSIEKPVGMNAKEVKEVEALAKEKNLPVFVCFTWHHKATLRYLKDLVDEGFIGDVDHMFIRCIKNSAFYKGRKLEWRFIKEEAGCGVLCDLGSHMLDLLNWLNVDAVGLLANFGTFVKERQKIDSEEWGPVTTDDWANLIIDLKNGANANVILSRGCSTCNDLTEVEIYGRNGYLKYSGSAGDRITVHTTDGVKEERMLPESYGTRHDLFQCKSFINLLNGKTDKYTTTLTDGLKAQYIIDAALLAGEERRYVKIDEVK